MAYLPGVPDMGPAPVSPIVGSSKTPIGAPKGISAIAHSVGKPGHAQHLGNIVGTRGAGSTALGGGDPAMHSLGHYGKKAPPLLGGQTAGIDPTAHAGANMIRGGGANPMRSHIREGGLGPGKMSSPGGPGTQYNMAGDTE
jgi:hypothetical protein